MFSSGLGVSLPRIRSLEMNSSRARASVMVMVFAAAATSGGSGAAAAVEDCARSEAAPAKIASAAGRNADGPRVIGWGSWGGGSPGGPALQLGRTRAGEFPLGAERPLDDGSRDGGGDSRRGCSLRGSERGGGDSRRGSARGSLRVGSRRLSPRDDEPSSRG